MVAWMRSLFPTFTVTYAPIENARQALVRAQDHKNVGIPGICIYRTACPKEQGSNSIPQAKEGFFYQGLTEDPTKFNKMQIVRVVAEYTLNTITLRDSDRDLVERTLMFNDAFTTLNFTIKGKTTAGDNYNISSTAPLQQFEPSYNQEQVDTKTGRISWYSLEKKFEIHTGWIKTHQDPAIQSILVQFKSLFEGCEVTDEMCENITIIPKVSNSN